MLSYKLNTFIYKIKKHKQPNFLVCALVNFLSLALGRRNIFSLTRLFSPKQSRGTIAGLQRLQPLPRDTDPPSPGLQFDNGEPVPRRCGRGGGYPTAIGSGPRQRLAIGCHGGCSVPAPRKALTPPFWVGGTGV